MHTTTKTTTPTFKTYTFLTIQAAAHKSSKQRNSLAVQSTAATFGASARGEALLVTLAGVGRDGDPLLDLLQGGRRRGGEGRGGGGTRFRPSQGSWGRARQGAGGAVMRRGVVPCTGVGAVTSGVLLGWTEFDEQ